MATDAGIGHGTLFKRGDGEVSESFVTVGEVINDLPFSMSKDAPEATHHGSPDRYREFVSGLRDGGEITVEVNYVPGGTVIANALADFNADVPRNYQIEWTDGSVLDFSALMTGPAVSSPLDDKMVATFTYKVSGKPVYTAAS